MSSFCERVLDAWRNLCVDGARSQLVVAELKVEVGLVRRQVAVSQTHAPAEEAEVDFGEFSAVIAGTVLRLWMFCLRLWHSGRAVHVAYANQAQESFLDGHVQAFTRLGGVPTPPDPPWPIRPQPPSDVSNVLTHQCQACPGT